MSTNDGTIDEEVKHGPGRPSPMMIPLACAPTGPVAAQLRSVNNRGDFSRRAQRDLG